MRLSRARPVSLVAVIVLSAGCGSKTSDPPTDLCPGDPAKTLPGVCGCDVSDADANGNGIPDCLDGQIDLCPGDPAKTLPGVCGCGVSDTDANGNGIPDCLDGQIDLCPGDPAKTLPGVCGCGVSDADANGNGIPDCLDGQIDLCPGDPAKTLPGVCGCGVSDADANGNGIPDCLDGDLQFDYLTVVAGANGSVTPSGTFPVLPGETITLVATGAPCYWVDQWATTGGTALISSDVRSIGPGPASVSVLTITHGGGNATLSVSFTADSTPSVTIAQGSFIQVNEGASVTLDGVYAADPDPGDAIVQFAWDLDGDDVYSDATTPSVTYVPQVGYRTARFKVFDELGCESPPATVLVNDMPRSGLAGEWLLDGSAADTSGNALDGTVNGPTSVNDRFGNGSGAFAFDGVDDTVAIGDPVPAPLRIQDAISLTAWIYVTELPPELALIAGSQYDVTVSGATIFYDSRSNSDGLPCPPGHIHFQIGNGSWHATNSSSVVPQDRWVFIAATRSANNPGKIYYDAVLQPSASATWSGGVSYDSNGFGMGDQKDLGSRIFKGGMDDVRVYGRELSAAEVEALYHDRGW